MGCWEAKLKQKGRVHFGLFDFWGEEGSPVRIASTRILQLVGRWLEHETSQIKRTYQGSERGIVGSFFRPECRFVLERGS